MGRPTTRRDLPPSGASADRPSWPVIAGAPRPLDTVEDPSHALHYFARLLEDVSRLDDSADPSGGGRPPGGFRRAPPPIRLTVDRRWGRALQGTSQRNSQRDTGSHKPAGNQGLLRSWAEARPPPTAIEPRTACPSTRGDAGPGFDVSLLTRAERAGTTGTSCLLRAPWLCERPGVTSSWDSQRNSQSTTWSPE